MKQETFETLKDRWQQDIDLLAKEYMELKTEHPEAIYFSPYDMEQKDEEEKLEHEILMNRWGAPHQ